MKATNTCPKCGSNDIIADAKAIDYDSGGKRDATIATYVDKHALLFKGEHLSKISAWVCAECGFIEYYADSPASLKIN